MNGIDLVEKLSEMQRQYTEAHRPTRSIEQYRERHARRHPERDYDGERYVSQYQTRRRERPLHVFFYRVRGRPPCLLLALSGQREARPLKSTPDHLADIDWNGYAFPPRRSWIAVARSFRIAQSRIAHANWGGHRHWPRRSAKPNGCPLLPSPGPPYKVPALVKMRRCLRHRTRSIPHAGACKSVAMVVGLTP